MSALSPSQPDRLSHGLWSLWEIMILLDAAKLLSISNWLTLLSQAMSDGVSVTINLQTMNSLKEQVTHLQNEFSELGMEASAISADRLKEMLLATQANAGGDV